MQIPRGLLHIPTAAGEVPEFWKTWILCLMQPALLYLLKTAENKSTCSDDELIPLPTPTLISQSQLIK